MNYTGVFARLFGKGVNGATVSPLSIKGVGALSGDFFNTLEPKGQWEAYIYNSVVRSIIDRRAEAFTNGKWYNQVNDKLSTTSESKLFYEILNSPNGLQTSSEFKQDVFRSLDIFGKCYILKIQLPGYTKVQGMVVLPAHLLRVIMNQSAYPFQISGGNSIQDIKLQFTDGTYSYNYDLTPQKDNIIVIRSLSVPGTHTSKLVGLQDQINKLYVANNASNNILKHHGALMLLTDDSKEGGALPMIATDKDQLQREYMDHYGMGNGQSLVWISNKAMKAQALSMPIKDLMLNETTRDATRQICDTIGYPIDLLGFEEGAKLGASGGKENEAKKMLYQDMIIPQGILIADSLSKSWFQMKEQVVIDFSEVEPLQQNQKDIADKNKVLVDTYVAAVNGGLMTTEQAVAEMKYNGIITQSPTK